MPKAAVELRLHHRRCWSGGLPAGQTGLSADPAVNGCMLEAAARDNSSCGFHISGWLPVLHRQNPRTGLVLLKKPNTESRA